MSEPSAVAYVLKMFPRLSETFVLDELLELEREGVSMHVYSLKRPDDGVVHADAARLRAPVSYVPAFREARRRVIGAHLAIARRSPRRYAAALRHLARRPSRPAAKHLSQAVCIASALQEAPVKHIHAHFASTAASVALHVYRLTGIPYSFTAHAKDIYRRTVTPRDVGRKLRAARFAVTVSDYNLRYLRAFPGGDRVVRIYNGVDLVQFAPNGVARDDPPLVLGVGRLVEKKGFGDLVRACRILRDQGHDFACRIVGSGERASSLRELVEELGVGGCVELVGPMAREDLLGLYPRASVVAAPCVVGTDGNRDGLPTVLIEAMALGVPVVATHVTGIPELVRPGITGLLVPERDPRALARAIAEVIGNEAAARGRARAARALIERDFDLRKNVAHLRRRLEASR